MLNFPPSLQKLTKLYELLHRLTLIYTGKHYNNRQWFNNVVAAIHSLENSHEKIKHYVNDPFGQPMPKSS